MEAVRAALFEPKDSASKVCFASEATVVGIAPYAQEDYYTPVPIVASPSDKTEKAPELAKWMQTVLDTWKTHEFGEKVNGPIWALASDGDSTYRAAKHIICMVKKIDKDSPLGKILLSLFGLNCWTSADGATSTCDPKHIFKRFATLLRSITGIMLDDNNIMHSHIIEHLTDLPNMTVEKAYQLLDPADKKNVPKAVTLLQSLLQLKDLPSPLNPTANIKWCAIVFVADMLGYFLRPFISVDMTLSEQVKCLSTYSFLAAGVQIKHGTAYMTGALYADSQATVKNIIFTIACLQNIDPTLEFYILHEGTDQLECVFGDC